MPTSTAGKSSNRTSTPRIAGASPGGADRGFTLLELVIVIVIIGVCLGMVLPQTGAFLYRDDFKSNVRGLAVTIGHARNKAILTQTIWAVIFDIEERTYWAAPVKYEHPESGAEPILVYGTPEEKRGLGGEIAFRTIQVWDQEPKDKERAVVQALPNGLMEPAVIGLVNAEDARRELRIKSFGGRLEYIEPEEDL